MDRKGNRTCSNCQKTFTRPAHLQRHLEAGSCLKNNRTLSCPNCQKTFNWPSFLHRHVSSGSCKKASSVFSCSVCHKSYSRKDRLMEHVRKIHPNKAPEKKCHSIIDVKDFTCCGQRFQSPREVWRHRQIHHYAKLRDGTGNRYAELDSSSEQSEDSNINTIEEAESYHMQDECDENITKGNPLESIAGLVNETGDEPPNPAPDNFGDLMDILHDEDAKQLFTKIGNTIVDRSAKKRFKTVKKRESFRLTPTALALCENGFAMEVLTKILDELLNKYKEMGGLMQIKLLADSLHPPIVTSLFETHHFSSLMLLNYIESVLSSKDKFLLDETLTIDVTHVASIEGGGRRLDAPDIDSFIRHRTGSWDPKNSNDDFRCLGFCLAASILMLSYLLLKLMMAMKTLHSEIPDNMTAEEFCKIWNDRVPGINLNPKDMNPNPAMRLTAKILLNSLWGKFCERANHSFTALVNNWYDLKKRMDSKESVINRIEQISDKEMVLSCKVKDPFLTETSMYNPVIGAYVTAYARTTLLEKCLEVVGDRALYTDTDSLVYLRIPGEPDAPRGEALGQLANELKTDEFGTCFQCYAPKSWRLEVGKKTDSNSWEKKRVIMKTKGIHLTSLGSSIERSINQRALWDELIDARLISRSQAEIKQSIKKFYEELGTGQHGWRSGLTRCVAVPPVP